MKIKSAFSLVELMVTLVIISVIASAMVPIITKKLKSQSITIGGSSGSSGELTMDCGDFGPNCGLCYPDKCVSCVKACLNNEALNVAQCKCETCVSLYGSNCLKCDIESCSECSSGYYVENGECTICPIGSYCDGTIKTVCEEGKYTDSTGQSSCKDCEVGYACSNGRKTICSEGNYSTSNASSCTTCPKGYYCIGGADKAQCSGNKYQDTVGNASCKTCGAGYYVSNDRASCLICPMGSSCSGDGTAIGCSAGSYSSSEGSLSCVSCPDGFYSTTPNATDSSVCLACSSKTTNCTKCNVATGVCSECESGYEVVSGVCEATTFAYTYTGSYGESSASDGSQVIKLKSSGTFKTNSTKKGTIYVIGGGGGGGKGSGGGGGGYITESLFTFVKDTEYAVTIGAGGASATDGSNSSLGTIVGEGGKKGTSGGGAGNANGGAYVGMYDDCSKGGKGKAINGEYYAGGGAGGKLKGYNVTASYCSTNSGGGGKGGVGQSGTDGTANTGGGGGGGGQAQYVKSGGGYGYEGKTGGKGGSGIVIIIIPAS